MKYDSNLFATHEASLRAQAMRLTRNDSDARDLVQDTWLLALEAMERLECRPDNFRGWLFVVMRNHWFNAVRKTRVRTNAREHLGAVEALDSSLSETRVLAAQFERAWAQVSPHAKSIAHQCLIDGDSQEEVSRRYGMTPGGVAASIHRTRAHLHESLFGVG